MILGYDSETSNLPLWGDPSDDPRQPHLLQIAAILYDLEGREVHRLATIVKPGDGCVIGPEAFAAHGITLERARDEGRDPVEVAREFDEMAKQATLIVGHNVSFDIRIFRIHAARHLGFKWEKPAPTFCTMYKSTGFTRVPATEAMRRAGRYGFKLPNLTEAHQHFFGEGFDGAHDALADVTASMRIFWHLTRNLGVPMFKPEKAA